MVKLLKFDFLIENMSLQATLEKFDDVNNLIKEYKYWKLLVRKGHTKLGACVAILKREAFPLSQVTEEEMAEYAVLTKEVESVLKELFNPYLVCHCAIMFVDKQIHFHILPRHREPISFAGKEWVDDSRGNPLIQKLEEPIPQEILNQIKEEIKKNL